MKILHVITKWEGGVGRYVLEATKELRKLGHTVKVISREDNLGCNSFLKSFGVLKEAVRKEKYDILNSHDWSIGFVLLGFKNHFCTFHGIEPKNPIFQNIVYNAMKEKVIVVGDSLKEKFEKANLVYEGVNLDTFKPNKKKINKIKKIGYAQQQIPFYNFDIISKSIPKGAKLVTAEGIPPDKMPDFYNKLDVFVSLPPKEAGFNLAWLEAMACNVDVIGNYNGIGNVLPIIHSPNDEIALNSKIHYLLRKEKKRNYRQWIIDAGFTWDRCVKDLLEVYENR